MKKKEKQRDLKQQNSKKKSKEPQTKASTGKAYVVASYMMLMLFVSMIVYLVYFQFTKSPQLLKNPYNTKAQKNAEFVVKGSILSSDGTRLAYTTIDQEGNEKRNYPYDNLFAQTVGYEDYGTSGLEATLSSVLLKSSEGVVDQLSKDLVSVKKNGDTVVTNLDVRLQQICSDALGNRKGAVVALDANTSKIKAMVSKPDFNPNTVNQDWEALNTDQAGSPFLNRALQGMYEPGSTFKIVTLLAFLNQYGSEGDISFDCTGEYTQGGYTIHCINNTAHGSEGIREAFANSCNCAFSYIATELLEEEQLKKAAEDLLFNKEFSFDLPSVKSKFRLDKTKKDGETMQTAIGQGDTLISPMHLAMITQGIYNHGEILMPTLVDHIQNAATEVISTESIKSLGQVMTESESVKIKQYMHAVVEQGTSQSTLSDLPYNIAGKTGTAEYDNENGFVHSWYTGFSENSTSDIVLTVLIEEAGEGDPVASAVAREIYQGYFGG